MLHVLIVVFAAIGTSGDRRSFCKLRFAARFIEETEP